LAQCPRVAVAVLNYNGLRWLSNCLSSVARTDYRNLDIYLVDNGSDDGSVDFVREEFPSVNVIRHSVNLGFAEGYDIAIEKIDADYVLLLNSDTVVIDPNWVKHLLDTMTKKSNVVAVTCKMVSMSDHSTLDSVGGMGIPFWRGFVDIGREQHDNGQYDSEEFEPFSFCGGAALIRRDVFLKARGFDRKFFMYFEDADLSWRLRLVGYRIAFAPQAKVAHYFSGSVGTKAVDARRLYYCQRNLLRAILKNCGSSLRWALRNHSLMSLIFAAGFCLVFLEPMKAVAVVRAILWNLLNLSETYRSRLTIQASRTTSEKEILTRMYPMLPRYQPHRHDRFMRILNTLPNQYQNSS
jgi:GT2 family glycosyltransferase